VQFNRNQLQVFKSQAYVKFWEMDRFIESSGPLKKARSKAIQGHLNGCKERIRLLTEIKASTIIVPPTYTTAECRRYYTGLLTQ
jgi:ubiquitin carboxyl-terminal hydrolase 25/28